MKREEIYSFTSILRNKFLEYISSVDYIFLLKDYYIFKNMITFIIENNLCVCV